jgi:hypothetical protein
MPSAVARRKGNGVAEGSDEFGAGEILTDDSLDQAPSNAWGAVNLYFKRGNRGEKEPQLLEDTHSTLAAVAMLERLAALAAFLGGRGSFMYHLGDFEGLIDDVFSSRNGSSSAGRCYGTSS